MAERRSGVSALAIAALGLLDSEMTAADLSNRFGDAGAAVSAALAEALLGELAGLGLVRIARDANTGPVYVRALVGDAVVDGILSGRSATEFAELERLRTDLLSTIAHELRTPLTAVRTSVGLLLDPSSDPSDDQRRSMLETIERNAARMQRVVGDILDLTRFRRGAVRLQLRRFDAGTMAASVVASIAPIAEQRKQHLVLSRPPDGGPDVYGDHRRLEQALLNLVSNAQRFTRDRGRVEVSVSGDDGFVRWRVADEGPGIPPEDEPHLFERFFVGRTDRSEARQGAGLGLPIALAIAQAHGGNIEVAAAPGRGSVFTLRVPRDGPGEDS